MSDFRPDLAPPRVTRAATALLAGSILVGCAGPIGGPGVSRYEPSYLNLTNEHAFSQALRRHYLELATNAYDRGDLDRSDFYSLRALMAAEGKLAQPSEAVRHADATGEAAQMGQRLSMLLMSGVRTGSPDLAGRAQAAYDCWLVEAGDGDPQIAQSCRYNALNAIAELEDASTGTQMVAAGGPTAPQGQTYVIENGAPSQRIRAHGGYTIEVITQHGGGYVPGHYVQERVPATYSVSPQPAPMYAAEPAPSYTVESAPSYAVETVPVMADRMVSVAAPAIEYSTFDGGFDTVPVISESEAAMVAYDHTAMAPMASEMTVDLGPAQSYPVYGTEPVETMPMVEMAALPMAHGGDTASALMDASANMQSDFAIFFGFDSDDVTIEAEDVLVDAIERIRLSGASRVALMGYTDSVGDARYNQLLAMRRAQAVRQYLQASLGNAVSFEILPVGEVQAVQNGGDGVNEALNRKVEIALQ